MPTPYGSRGGMVFGAQELRVLRRALALALKPSPVSAQEARDCLRLAESLDEAMRESARMRAFLVADLARYRAALPGTATGYLALLDEALAAGHRPGADDLAALGALRGNPAAAALLARCAPQPPTAKPTLPAARTPRPAPTITLADTAGGTGTGNATAPTTSSGTRLLLALPGGRQADERPAQDPPREPARKPAQEPAREPATPKRPVPTPGEVFPRRKPAPPAPDSRHHLAAG
ncbi:hypothetical protein GCM10010385_05060 [Streptomyces geysiriensis]|uniref:hypothetical protein n=1 Tax=Streptomyces TaxID=1883 RepID=UPI000FBDC152|nr:hypothetical protein [Streptomyces sp. WAC06128]RSS68439.1 hypothetical protein EF911_34030 [Streptomyces sp. WAC06128]GGY58802.1 hypothetical protein GCM10010385_05060 [Streptomyces geysiriensis]